MAMRCSLDTTQASLGMSTTAPLRRGGARNPPGAPHPRGPRHLEVPSVQGGSQVLADLGQLGPGAAGAGALPQRVLLQVLLQLRLPEEQLCHVIYEEQRETVNGTHPLTARPQPGPSGTSEPPMRSRGHHLTVRLFISKECSRTFNPTQTSGSSSTLILCHVITESREMGTRLPRESCSSVEKNIKLPCGLLSVNFTKHTQTPGLSFPRVMQGNPSPLCAPRP